MNPYGVLGLACGPYWNCILLSVLVSILILWFGLCARSGWCAAAYGLVLGGAVGNVIDRLRLGHVIDFVIVALRALHLRWYTLNLADACVVGILTGRQIAPISVNERGE